MLGGRKNSKRGRSLKRAQNLTRQVVALLGGIFNYELFCFMEETQLKL
jgi:hypothetical protein